jgi:lauroyl/myristoyl acyltransferase
LIPVLVAVGIWSLATLRFQTELLPLFPQKLPSVRMLEKAQAHFVSESEVLAVAQPGTNPGWSELGKLATQLQGQPGIGSAQVGLGSSGSPAQWLAGMVAALPPARFAEFYRALAPASVAARLQQTLGDMSGAMDETEMGRLRFDPLRLNELIFAGADPLTATLNLPPVLSIDSSRPLKTFADDQRFVAQVESALAAAQRRVALSPRPRFLLTGQPAITADISIHMRRDIVVMLVFTIALTSLAFWLTYRSLMPLLWIIVAQVMAVLCAVVAARLIFTEINVLSIGFSSILLGVGMDYCILVYHFFAQPGDVDEHEWRELRHAIWLSSATTAATFGLLYFSSFPGLRQLAVLVGIGLLATAFFATTFLADLLRRRRPAAPRWLGPASDRCARFMSRHRLAFRLAAAAVVAATLLLWPQLKKFPFYDPGLAQLEPTNLESYRAQQILQDATAAMPQPVSTPDATEANRRAWAPIDPARVRDQFRQAGFDPTWAGLTVGLIDALNRWHAGTLDLTGPAQADAAWVELRADLNRTAVHDFKRLSIFMFLVVVLLCALAHRSVRLVGLNLVALGMSMVLLALGLYASQTSMTILSLLCLPLMIGLVIDYSLHILLALEHAHGNLIEAFRHLAVPVLLTGTASIIGFTAPMLSSQPALQNFGNVMDLGTIAAVASGLILLPALYGGLRHVHAAPDRIDTPHSGRLYRAGIFSLGEAAARALPLRVTRTVAGGVGHAYAWTHPRRVRVVRANLRLLDASLDAKTARRVYAEFGQTLADYFYLGTRPIAEAARLVSTSSGHEYFDEARRAGRGAIVVTAHFGLFELGALLLAQAGCRTTVLTFPEPSPALSAWRAAFRRRWQAETIEVGADSFAFLEIADRLRRGEMIATLIDRPHPGGDVAVMLPNGPARFSAGILLLAAHCGCPVIPAMIARKADGSYHSQVGPPFHVRARATRADTLQFYTQQIADIFLPSLCAHPEQWYQFVPLSPSRS